MLTPETPGRSSPWVRVAVGLVGLLLAGLAWWWWAGSTPAAPDEDIDQALAVVNPGYVGIETCAKCHPKRAEVVKTSRHYVACRDARGVAAPGFAPGRGKCETRVPGLRFEMTRSGEDFVATAVTTTPEGENRVAYPVGLVYGSANTRDEMYFSWQGDHLVRLPFAWLYPQDRWGTDTDDLRILDTHTSCLECHNTWIASVAGPPGRYQKEGMLLGVTCERCHGPGQEHTAYHREHPDAAAHAIVHPGKLSRERLIDICAQCHGNTRLLGQPFNYRPGQPLDTAYHTARAKYREDDTTTNQVQYLAESKCFQKTEMTCITCHDPHRPGSARAACAQCHTPADCRDQPRQPDAVRGDCVGCHMPNHLWMNSHFYTTADDQYLPVAPRSEHRIAVYPEAKQAVELAWFRKQDDARSRTEAARLAAQLTDHWLKEAEQMRRADRLMAAIGAYREALQVTPNPATRKRLDEVIARQVEVDDLLAKLARGKRSPTEDIQLLTRVLQLRPDDARIHHDLGTIYAMTGQRAQAIPHLQAVAQGDPSNTSGITRLAWMAQMEERPEDALKLCAEADKIEPGHPTNHFVWGMALAKQKRWADAEQHFRKALERNPTSAEANQGLSDALRQQGQAAEAVRYARRAAHWTGAREPTVLITLADAYVAANRIPDARKALEQAQSVVPPNNPGLAQAIRDRLRGLQ
jgi:tetratricopeptide (TPR) repeat protein